MRIARYSMAELATRKMERRPVDWKCLWCGQVHTHLIGSAPKFGPTPGRVSMVLVPGQVDGNTGLFRQTCGPRNGLPFQDINGDGHLFERGLWQ